jgi:hypothetical protein
MGQGVAVGLTVQVFAVHAKGSEFTLSADRMFLKGPCRGVK